ncbi:hypothetical protein DPMN_076038 [Dreissena polymorpha]|uniref:Ig-like domain-containing protein n=1 Tax=Dreissena polymorpha TaxID=45954 RepID=A0A9D4BFF0_DREPO|nr:hypothetical protein DPMN_076038 [Dreissena polymorpha]
MTSKLLYFTDGPDSLTMSPSSISYTMIEGESMNNIICSATCYPEQCTFIWTKSGVETSISNTGVLSLGSLQRRDAGIYTCTVRNPGSNATASSQGIEVLVRCMLKECYIYILCGVVSIVLM